MRIPFWIPALWIGLTLAALPKFPMVTLVGYHAICLLGCARHPWPRWGRMPVLAWGGLAAAALLVPWLLRGPIQAHLPTAGAQGFLAHWPGGFLSYVAYTLTLNSLCEEAYWRHALVLDHPGWSDTPHGLAFGLHHLVGNGLVFGWAAAIPAFAYTAVGGWLGIKVARRTGGLGVVILGHSLLNALSFAWLWKTLG